MRNLIIALCFLFFSLPASSQGLFESAQGDEQSSAYKNLSFNGYVRGSVYGGSSSFDFSSIFGELGLQTLYTPSKAYLYADVRIREGLQFNENNFEVELKEAYAGYHSDKFDIYLGNQIVTWGRTDGFNPTNNINPNDYFFLSAEPDDQKLPNFMLRARYRITPAIDIDLTGIPWYRPSVYRYDLFSIDEGAAFETGELPEKSIENSSIAARINFDLPAIGYSLSWFHGYDPFYGFDIESIDLSHLQEPGIVYRPDYFKKDAFGADMAIPVGSWVIRAEVAYNQTYNYEKYMFVPNPDLLYVLGLEHDFFGITTILQYIGKYVNNYQELEKPVLDDATDIDKVIQYAKDQIYYESELFNQKVFLQQEKTNHALFLSLTRSFLYDALRADLSVYYNFTSDDFFIRPALSWNITDALSSTVGAYIMTGPENSVFSYASDVLNGAFVELRVTF